MRSREALLEAMAQGESFEFLFFWGHRPGPGDAVTKSCLSQWYEAAFSSGGTEYRTAEHFMMARKAEIFGDLATRDAIMIASDPGKAKALGRKVTGFDESVWIENRWDIVVEANMLKFSQQSRLQQFLLSTQEKVLVEASPLDSIWGIGLAADALEAKDPAQWRGPNLLGFALMEVRSKLRVAAAQQVAAADVSASGPAALRQGRG